jgi:hypothetical protein
MPRPTAPLHLLLSHLLLAACAAPLFAATPTTAPLGATDKLPHIHLDLKNRQIRVECQAVNATIPLEFICVVTGGNEYEAVLRTPARPSDIHIALLALGLTPGEPMRYDQANHKWLPPHGPPLHLSVEFVRDGNTLKWPIDWLVRAIRTKEPAPPMTFIFDGSRITEDGTYGADATGYVVALCNREFTMIDVPEMISSAMESREWEPNPDTLPPTGTPMTLIIEPGPAEPGPIHAAHASPTTAPVAGQLAVLLKIAADGALVLEDQPVRIADLPARLDRLKKRGPIIVRIAAATSTDPAIIQSARSAVRDAGLQSQWVAPTTGPTTQPTGEEPGPFGG